MTLEPGRSGEHMETAGLGPQGPRSEKPLPHSEEFGPDDPRISRPASAAQLGMWILRQFQTERYSTAVYKAAMIDGDLNYLALSNAFAVLIADDETLRMRFLLIGDDLQTTVEPRQICPLELVDLSGLVSLAPENTARRIAHTLCSSGSNLEHGPLIRAVVMRIRAGRNVLLLLSDRIVADRRGITLICSELFRLYGQFAGGRNEAAACPSNTGDFMAEDASEPYSLPQDLCSGLDDRPSRQAPEDSFKQGRGLHETRLPERIHFSLNSAESSLIHGAAFRLRREPASVFLACFYLLLSRLSLSKEVSVGVEERGRALDSSRGEGPSPCRVPVSVSLADDPTFATLVHRVDLACSAAFDLSRSSWEEVIDYVAMCLASSQAPFQATFEFTEIDPETPRGPGLRFTTFSTPFAAPESDLDVGVTSQSGLFQGVITCDRFYREVADAITQAFHTAVLQVCDDPDCKVSEYSLLTGGWPARPITGRNHAEPPVSCASAVDEIRRQAAARPDAIAAVCGDDHVSYGCLEALSNRLAAALRRFGVRPESYVAAIAPRDIPTLIGMLGIFKAEAIYLPLDPAYPDSQIALMLEDSRPALLLSRAGFERRYPGYSGAVVDLEAALAAADDECDYSITRGPLPDQLAYLMYTSGSTGKPKGVMVSHKGMSGHVLAKASDLNLGVTDVVAQTASCSFDISIWQFLSPLVSGAVVVIFNEEVADDHRLLLKGLRRMSVTVWETAPVLMGIIVDEEKWLADRREQLPALRVLISNAEALPTDLAVHWQELYPHVQLLNTYGATEVSDDLTHYRIPPNYKGAAAIAPLGAPFAGGTVHVLDECMRPVIRGFPGEIYLGGPGVARGYANQPALTSERFVPDPFSPVPGERLYRTGDLARLTPHGDLDFLGRVDDQIKIRGHRVEPDQIASIIRKHPAVLQAAVISSKSIGDEISLIGFVVWREGVEGDLESLWAFLESNLPSYMTPASIVECPGLPMNQNGKLDRKSLSAIAGRRARVAPRTLTEIILAEIFSEVLAGRQVGACDDFFAQGGTARCAVRLATRIQSVMETEIPLSLIYKARTVEAIARVIDRKKISLAPSGFGAGLTEGELRSLLSDHLD